MNLIPGKEVYEPIPDLYYVHQWRKEDFKKIDEFIQEIYTKIQQIDPEFEFQIEKKSDISYYLCDFISFYDNYHVYQKYKNHEKNFNFLVPKLLYDNYFILNNALYIPLMFLEKGPIDRVLTDDKNKIFANLNPTYNFTFDFDEKKGIYVYFKSKKIESDIFLKVLFEDDKDKWEEFLNLGLINDFEYSLSYKRKFAKFLGYHKDSYFDDKNIAEWIDNYLILDFYKGVFQDYYGFNDIKSIILKIIEYYKTGKEIDMADIRNRRVVLIEYLIRPLFELYTRLLISIIDKKSQNFLPTMNPNVMLTTGFNKLMHRGNLYDISLPYPSPLINKISQDILIIKDGRLPKSWIRNDDSAFGVVCPISVSAQKTASNIILTTNTLIDKYGKIYLKINEEN